MPAPTDRPQARCDQTTKEKPHAPLQGSVRLYAKSLNPLALFRLLFVHQHAAKHLAHHRLRQFAAELNRPWDFILGEMQRAELL